MKTAIDLMLENLKMINEIDERIEALEALNQKYLSEKQPMSAGYIMTAKTKLAQAAALIQDASHNIDTAETKYEQS